METAAGTVADALVFDLEDAVPPSRVPEGRENVGRVVAETDFGHKEVGVRINGIGTEWWREDLEAATEADVDAVMAPKIQSAANVEALADAVDSLTTDPPTVRLAIESPAGLLASREIGQRCDEIPYVTGLSFGLADYCRAIGAPAVSERVREQLTFRVGAVAATADLDAFASAHLDIDDVAGVRTAAELARSFGYAGMGAIHPRQLTVINEVFTPDPERVEEARRAVTRYEKSDADSVLVNGEFLDEAIVARHRALIERYEALMQLENEKR